MRQLLYTLVAVIVSNYMAVYQGLIIQEGNSADIHCSVAKIETSLWRVQRPDGTYEPIAQGGVVYSQHRNEFKLIVGNQSSGSNTSYYQTLTLKQASGDDDGLYLCEEEGQTRTTTTLTVEIPPVIHLKKDGVQVSSTIDVIFNEEVAIECVAEGGKPPGSITWRVNGKEKTGSSLRDDPTASSERRVTSILSYLPAIGDSNVTCVSGGQQVIPEKEVSFGVNVQYLPNCVLGIDNTTNEFVITCSCEANPNVKSYGIFVNDSLFSEELKTTLPSANAATVYCKATNDVGTYTTKREKLKPFHEKRYTALIIGLSVTGTVVVLVAVFAICLYLKKLKEDMREVERRANTSNLAGIDAAQRLQNATRPSQVQWIPLMTEFPEQD